MLANPIDGPSWVQISVLPSRAAYLIKAGSRRGLRRAVQEASSRWGGIAEPILPVRVGGRIDNWWLTVLKYSRPSVLVNIDVDDSDAAVVASNVGLPLVALARIDQYGGDASWTMSPMRLPVVVDSDPAIAASDSPLWHAVSLGDLTIQNEQNLAESGIAVERVSRSNRVLLASFDEQGMINQTASAFSENYAADGPLDAPLVLWVTPESGYADSLFFWNLRVLRPLRFSTAPMFIVSERLNFTPDDTAALSKLLARPAGFTPDIALLSIGVRQHRLDEIAGSLGLAKSTERFRLGSNWSSQLRTPPFTYLTGERVNPRRLFDFERRYGEQVEVQAHFVAGRSSIHATMPIRLKGRGPTLIRVRTDYFGALPESESVAKAISRSAHWRDHGIEFGTMAMRQIRFELELPTLESALDLTLKERIGTYSLSDKGRLGVAFTGNGSDLVKPNMLEAISGLTTPRSKELLKELRRMRRDGHEDAALADLAATWGGRNARRYRSSSSIQGLGRPQAAAALELACSNGWAERGLQVECGHCGMSSFLEMSMATSRARCPGCRSREACYSIGESGLEVFYRLDTFIDLLSDQGVLPHLSTIAWLRMEHSSVYMLPGVDFFSDDLGRMEIDIVGLLDGKVASGEVKSSASEFTSAQIARDLACSKRLGADLHIMSASDVIPSETADLANALGQECGLPVMLISGSGAATAG